MEQNISLNGGRTEPQVARSMPGEVGRQAETAQRSAVMPPVDIFEDDAGFTLVADLPGVSRERLTVRVDGDNLVIEGAADSPVDNEMTLIYGEVLNPLYRRAFTLSRELDAGRIDAKLENGVLRLRIPKAEEARPRRIEVALG